MAKFKSIEEFKKQSFKKETEGITLLVGVGTCGIAAGANKLIKVFKDEIKARRLKNIEVKKVGCLGLCFCEPNVEVIAPKMPNVLYGKVDEQFAIRIVEDHIIDRRIINERLYDIPRIDI